VTEAIPSLSVIIPAYNERERLGPNLGSVLAYLREHFPSFELIVVDDGSRDQTAEMARRILADEPRARVFAYQPNRGKGYAIRTGVLASRGERVLFMDADLSTPIEEIPRALKAFDILFPLSPTISWLTEIGPSQCIIVKMMPTALRGLGANQRRWRYGFKEFSEFGYTDFTHRDLIKWNNSLISLLRPEKK